MCVPAFQNIIDIKLFDTIFVLYYVEWLSWFVFQIRNGSKSVVTVVSLIILLKGIDGFSEFTLLKLPHFFLNIPVRLFVSFTYRDVQRID